VSEAGTTRPASTDGERFGRDQRLRRRADYLRCYRTGGRRHGRLAVVHYLANEQGHARLGITASRKVGGAVVRHRLKRRVREVFRRWRQRDRLPPLDLVVHLKPAAATADFAALRGELLQILGSLLAGGRPPGGRRRRR
jgi:ribonuclease P protein component